LLFNKQQIKNIIIAFIRTNSTSLYYPLPIAPHLKPATRRTNADSGRITGNRSGAFADIDPHRRTVRPDADPLTVVALNRKNAVTNTISHTTPPFC
jgi:hypothetical protein